MKEDDELERLARRGRALRSAEERAAEREATRAADRRENVGPAVSAYVRWVWVPCGLAAGFVGWETLVLGSGVVGLSVATVVGLALFFATRPIVGRWAIGREAAFLARQPFAVTGYFEAIGSDTNTGSWTLDVVFGRADDPGPSSAAAALAARPVPIDDALVEDVLRALGAQVERIPSDPNARRVRIAFDDDESSTLNNARVVRWMHRTLGALRAMHARHPIAAVRVRGFG